MRPSLLASFVNGTRQLLSVQLFIATVAVALAGWTLSVGADVFRERERLRDRVIQLEAAMAGRGMLVPVTPTRVTPQDTNSAYPPSLAAPVSIASEAPPAFDPRQVIGDLFAPPAPLRTVVLHVRSDADAEIAGRIGRELTRNDPLAVTVAVMGPSNPATPGYFYFDGRQSRDAAALVARYNDAARASGIPPWSAQLRGTALPARGEYSADRLDLVLPPLPEPAPPAPAEASASPPG